MCCRKVRWRQTAALKLQLKLNSNGRVQDGWIRGLNTLLRAGLADYQVH
jgi:hypothetical protein